MRFPVFFSPVFLNFPIFLSVLPLSYGPSQFLKPYFFPISMISNSNRNASKWQVYIFLVYVFFSFSNVVFTSLVLPILHTSWVSTFSNFESNEIKPSLHTKYPSKRCTNNGYLKLTREVGVLITYHLQPTHQELQWALVKSLKRSLMQLVWEPHLVSELGSICR